MLLARRRSCGVNTFVWDYRDKSRRGSFQLNYRTCERDSLPGGGTMAGLTCSLVSCSSIAEDDKRRPVGYLYEMAPSEGNPWTCLVIGSTSAGICSDGSFFGFDGYRITHFWSGLEVSRP